MLIYLRLGIYSVCYTVLSLFFVFTLVHTFAKFNIVKERVFFNVTPRTLVSTVFARVICAIFSILAAEKSGCVKYADFFYGSLDLGFVLV